MERQSENTMQPMLFASPSTNFLKWPRNADSPTALHKTELCNDSSMESTAILNNHHSNGYHKKSKILYNILSRNSLENERDNYPEMQHSVLNSKLDTMKVMAIGVSEPSDDSYPWPQRSHSFGSMGMKIYKPGRKYGQNLGVDGFPSRNGISRDYKHSDELVESTRKQLTRLTTDGSNCSISSSPDGQCRAQESCSPVLPEDVHRKYSIGSRLVPTKRQHLLEEMNISSINPVDLTCKRKRSIDCSISPSFKPSSIPTEFKPDQSILKSVLTDGRTRSHTLSVCGMKGLKKDTRIPLHQKVTLAKKNYMPVTRSVIDQLREIVKFACRQPEFIGLPIGDQRTLLFHSGAHLLLLYMAETNFHFAVTPVWKRDELEEMSMQSTHQLDYPTDHFVDTIQNFISKCQSIGISHNEYFYMKMILLFHSGSKSLQYPDLANKRYSESRQDLQDLADHSHPNDRLRCSKLLLALHNLVGINSSMLEALFCNSLVPNGGLEAFLENELDVELSQVQNGPLHVLMQDRTTDHLELEDVNE